MEFSITDYPNLAIYGVIFVVSIFLSETFKERASVMLFILFFLSSVHVRFFVISKIGIERDVDYFIFYAVWEYCLFVLLYWINRKAKWIYPIYFIQFLAVTLNLSAAAMWDFYAKEVYYWYKIINQVLIESTILSLISKDNKKGILFICFLLIAIPYAANLLF